MVVPTDSIGRELKISKPSYKLLKPLSKYNPLLQRSVYSLCSVLPTGIFSMLTLNYDRSPPQLLFHVKEFAINFSEPHFKLPLGFVFHLQKDRSLEDQSPFPFNQICNMVNKSNNNTLSVSWLSPLVDF